MRTRFPEGYHRCEGIFQKTFFLFFRKGRVKLAGEGVWVVDFSETAFVQSGGNASVGRDLVVGGVYGLSELLFVGICWRQTLRVWQHIIWVIG